MDPGSSLDSMTSQLGDSGTRPAPQVPYWQNGRTNPRPAKAASQSCPREVGKKCGMEERFLNSKVL